MSDTMPEEQKLSYDEFVAEVGKGIAQKGFVYFDVQSISSKYSEFSKIIDELNTSAFGKYKVKKCDDSESEKYDKSGSLTIWGYFIYIEDDCFLHPVKNVVSFLELVFSEVNIDLNRYFRGQKAHYDITPSLFRNRQYVLKEMEINARLYNDRPDDFRTCNSTFEKLVKLKHFDAPSRLLDLTSNPLVALFFACFTGNKDKDDSVGVVLEAYSRKDEEKISVSSDTVIMLTSMTSTRLKTVSSDSSGIKDAVCISCACGEGAKKVVPKRNEGKSCYKKCVEGEDSKSNKQTDKRKTNLKKSWERLYIDELSHQCKKEGLSIYWDDLCYTELNQCILVHPPLNNQRIVRQKGCFIMCGMNPSDIFSPPESLFRFFRKPNGKRTVYYILPDDKKDILKELETLGIDEYFIFPEFDRDIKVVSERSKMTPRNLDKSI